MKVREWLRDLTVVAYRYGQPGGAPPGPAWLRRYLRQLLVAVTFLLVLAARANVHSAGVMVQIVAVLGTVPLALVVPWPLVAWRLAWVAGLLASFWPTPRENAWPWGPVQILVFLPVMLAVGATQRLGVTLWAYVLTVALVVGAVNPNNQAGVIVLVTLLVLAGDQVRRRRGVQRDLEEEEERSAVLAERTRIAREMHDVVAHHMSMIAVRAETAPYRLGELAEPARAEFGQISAAAREAMTEMRRLLGVLRSEAHEVPVAPQPGLADVPDLVAGARRAGTPVELTMPDRPVQAPPAVELTAYRIVQEALSNVARHAPGAPARVVLGRTPSAVTVTVSNPGTGRAAATGDPVPGHGLLGMRERAAMLDGHLSAGPGPDGGFVVRALLPVTEPATDPATEAAPDPVTGPVAHDTEERTG